LEGGRRQTWHDGQDVVGLVKRAVDVGLAWPVAALASSTASYSNLSNCMNYSGHHITHPHVLFVINYVTCRSVKEVNLKVGL